MVLNITVLGSDCMFLKTYSKNLADQLVCDGFQCVMETVNGQTVYCFVDTEDLKKYCQDHYSDAGLFRDEHLNF